MLQQTRVAQGTPYFFVFTTAFYCFDLAEPRRTSVKIMARIRYYSRARNLHKTAQYVAFELSGVFETYIDLLKLKGVGEYTAIMFSIMKWFLLLTEMFFGFVSLF
jgi:A/G-specific adenine glycosylase